MAIAFEFITGVQVGIEFGPEEGIYCLLNLGILRIWFIDKDMIGEQDE